ncbi:virulence RhuM family protein [Candidatus Saccharibacteria bacterium]|nr:virulence RhuM family protein [Candidatus Saccharibacteria bacterium]
MERGVVIYDATEGEVVFDVDKEKETIWATQEEIAQLFNVDRTVVGRHLRNIFRDEELEEERVCAKNARTAADGKTYLTKFYNLDAIISVGYRVNSKKATKFRVWATRVLKSYVVDGAAVNERRLKELPEEKLRQVEGALGLVARLIEKTELEEGEAKGVLEVIAQYGKTLETIKEFDSGQMPVLLGNGKTRRAVRGLTIGDVKNLAADFGEFREGEEEKFERFLERLTSEAGGKTVAEKAARLLYYVCNTAPFTEGNRQIGAVVFIYFLTINDFRLAEGGETRISDRALTAIVLLMAESKQEEEELMVGLVARLLEN